MNDLQKLKEIFLSNDIDSEDYQDNLALIKDWETELLINENLLDWQEHDVTKRIMAQAKQTHKDVCMRLMNDRDLSKSQRLSLFARKDAMEWMMSLASKEPEEAIKQIQSDIKKALNATN